MINKKQDIRVTQGEGKAMVRRRGATKLDEEYDEHACPVKFKFALIPGECWHLPCQAKSNRIHCDHPELERGELDIWTSHLSEDTKKKIQGLEEHVGTGSQTKNCMIEFTDGFHTPPSVMQTVRTDAEDKNKSSAALLIEHLNDQVDKGKMCFSALCHTVATTSLLAIGKAQKREELLKKKTAEAALKKGDDATTDEETPTLTEEEIRELAGDLVKEGLKFCHTGRLRKKDNPVEIMVNKMKELLDFGSALCTVKETLQASLLHDQHFVAR